MRLLPLLFADQSLLAYRHHQTTSSSDRREAMVQTRCLRRLFVNSPDNTPEQRETAKRAYRPLSIVAHNTSRPMTRRTLI